MITMAVVTVTMVAMVMPLTTVTAPNLGVQVIKGHSLRLQFVIGAM